MMHLVTARTQWLATLLRRPLHKLTLWLPRLSLSRQQLTGITWTTPQSTPPLFSVSNARVSTVQQQQAANAQSLLRCTKPDYWMKQCTIQDQEDWGGFLLLLLFVCFFFQDGAGLWRQGDELVLMLLFSTSNIKRQTTAFLCQCDCFMWYNIAVFYLICVSLPALMFLHICNAYLIPVICRTNLLSVTASVLFDTANKTEISSHRSIFQTCQSRHVS